MEHSSGNAKTDGKSYGCLAIAIFSALIFLIIAVTQTAGESSPESSNIITPGTLKTIMVGSNTIRLRFCPAGSFKMGSPATEQGRNFGQIMPGPDTESQCNVTLTRSFWMGETEVTQGLWREIMGYNPSRFKVSDDYPVEHISWDDCQKFLKKLNDNPSIRKVHLHFALPSEAQWEYACRAGSLSSFSGNGQLNDMGWYDFNSDNTTHLVAQKRPNDWGLYDMHGNVAEWCQDWHMGYFGLRFSDTDPLGDTSGSLHGLRGGAYTSPSAACRSAWHGAYTSSASDVCSGLRLMSFASR